MTSPSPEQKETGEAAATPVLQLYKARRKIHPRSVSGVFATWRWVCVWLTQLLYYGLPWIEWNDRQAVLFHIAERKFYVFGLILWPQDVFLLAVILIIAAYALFLFSAVAGRLWCGYACPQTVYTEIFIWIEKKLEGDHAARTKLDKAPLDAHKFRLRATKYSLWALFSLWTGFTFVGYFTPIHALWDAFWAWELGPWAAFWIFFYAAFTYAFAGHLREQACVYMCPYARFQGAMFDPDTLVITYDTERGEPRGHLEKDAEKESSGKGDCIDCGLCVQVCPTGIDIRNGLQYECIGCAACVDVCDGVMDKLSLPRGLVRYSTENAVTHRWGRRQIMARVIRPRTVIYTLILLLITLALAWGIANKPDLRVNVLHDRAVLGREVQGQIENLYRLQVMNITEREARYLISVTGLEGIRLSGENRLEVGPASTRSFNVAVRVPLGIAPKGSHSISFDIKAEDNENVAVRVESIFIAP